MIAAAAERGWIDGRRAHAESVMAIVRAGAGIVITYAAADVATWLAGAADDATSRRRLHPGARAGPRPRVAPPARPRAARRWPRAGRRRSRGDRVGRPELSLLVDRARARRRPAVVADGVQRRRAGDSAAAMLLRAGLGRWLTVAHSFLGRIGPSQYVPRADGAGAVAVRRRAIALPRRVSVHQEHGVVPAVHARRARA